MNPSIDLQTELKNFLTPDGKLKSYPAKARPRALALLYLAGKVEPDRRYTEKEVNALLDAWHTFGDPCLWRRDMFEHRLLGREKDGSAYWLVEPQPAPAATGL